MKQLILWEYIDELMCTARIWTAVELCGGCVDMNKFSSLFQASCL